MNDGLNKVFPIYNNDGTSFHNLVIHKATIESVVMSLGDKISGDVYYINNALAVTMKEYVEYEGVHYRLVNPPTIVREGIASENGDLRGMTKYSFEFYHPMYLLGNFAFSDVAVNSAQDMYLSHSRSFSWIGTLHDFADKLNANLVDTEWCVEVVVSGADNIKKANKKSDVLTFQNQFVSDALKTAYETWEIPFVVSVLDSSDSRYSDGKRFVVTFGLPNEEIYDSDGETPFVFHYGQGVGLKNNSRNPRNNKIVTRLIGYGSEDNIPYGYPQIQWYGTAGQSYTYGDRVGVFNNVTIGGHTFAKVISYPIYKGILGGQYVELIKHPYTRTNLMPVSYRTTLFNKVSPYNSDGTVNTDYDPDIELVDYIDAIGSDYHNVIISQEPSTEIHDFPDIKPMLAVENDYAIVAAVPLNNDMTPATSWDDTMDDNGEYVQSHFKITLPQLQFDIYACAAITQSMQINMRSGACMGCTFDVEVDWEDYKKNFYLSDGTFDPVIHTTTGDGHVRDGSKYPNSSAGQISVIVKKDLETFGTIMPNIYQQPQSGDYFVILGISLPTSYIENAETRLSLEMTTYLKENNDYYYDYPLKFDEYFLAQNLGILNQFANNKIVRFEYAGDELQLYIKQITIKYGENVLPKYEITLTDNIDVVMNKIGQTMDDIKHINDDLLLITKNTQSNFNRLSGDIKNGKIGRFYYYAQEWIDTNLISYAVTEVQAPYFSYNDEFWVFNPKENGTYTLSDMGTPHENSVDNPSNWVRMLSSFSYIITDALFGNYAHFGSAIINGDWMISQHGKINGVDSTNYANFRPELLDDIYLCDGIIFQSTNYTNTKFKDLVAGNQYQFKIKINSRSGSPTIYAVVGDGTQSIGDELTIGSSTNEATLTFTPTTSESYCVRFKMSAGSTSASITCYVDNVFIPNYAVNLYTGKSYLNAIEARGTIRANLVYSETKYLEGVTSYTIDPETEPYGSFFVNNLSSDGDCNITLPNAKDYEGIEFKFFCYYGRLSAEATIYSSQGIWFTDSDGYAFSNYTLKLKSNMQIIVKSMNGYWFVVQGEVEIPSI